MANSLEAVFARGAAALDAGDLPGAEQLFRSIIEADSRAHPAWNALSVVAVRAGFPELALERARHALEFDRRNPVYLNSLGVAYGELDLFADSEQAFRRALKAKPAYAEGLFNLGKVLHKLGRLAEALRAYERVYAMDRAFPGLLPALIHMYRKHGRADRALAVLQESSGLDLDDFGTLYSELIAELEGIERAVAWLREQLAQRPDLHGVRFSIAELLLAQRQWREGWREYLWRPAVIAERVNVADGSTHVPPPLPARLDGKSVRLRRDQGMGDSLFFLRFAPELIGRGAAVSVVVPRNMAAVLGGSGVDVIAEEDAPVTGRKWDHDLWISDLPALLETTAAPPAFPLAADAARTEGRRQELARLGPAPYLALTWRAGIDVLRNREFGNSRAFLSKEVPLAALGQALRGWPGTLLTLQREPYAGEIDALASAAGAPVHDLSALNDDLPEMLAALALLDEYVAVSNTNIHLLAGLGRTARVLVPYPPEWRWGLEGSSPWFPGFSVYREPQTRGWTQPLERLRGDLIG